MKKIFKIVLVLLVVVGAVVGLAFAYLEMSKERAAEAEREKPVVAKSRVSVGTNGEAILTLDQETQKRIALKVESVAPTKMVPESKGYGRVLDPAPLVALLGELASAEAALVASQKEFERVKLLNEQKNTSDRALQTAESAARRDQILVDSARTRLVLASGKAIAERRDLAAFVFSLASSESALVRIDLPAGEVLDAPPVSARLVLASAEDKSIPAQLLGPATSADPKVQGQGFLFLVKTNSAGLVPGTAGAGYLQFGRQPLNGFTIPDSAVVRSGGEGWIYVQTGADTFARRKTSLDHSTDGGWFVTNGVAAKDRVVVLGAQALLSEEQKYQIKLLD